MQGQGSMTGKGSIAAAYPSGQRPQGGLPQGGSGLDPAYLGLQLRKLQKKGKGLVKQVQAGAAREAFWKSTAQTAEHAVDEVSCCVMISCPVDEMSFCR